MFLLPITLNRTNVKCETKSKFYRGGGGVRQHKINKRISAGESNLKIAVILDPCQDHLPFQTLVYSEVRC